MGPMKTLAVAAIAALLSPGPARASLVELTGAVRLQSGETHSCVLTSSGGVQCWGGNYLGDGRFSYRASAGPVIGLSSGVTAIAVSRGSGRFGSGGHTCVITESGGVKCWGANNRGQLGDGTTTPRLSPVDIAGVGGPAVAIAAGFMHTCAVLTSGALKCWGANESGQLGDGTTVDRLLPTDVAGMSSGVADVSAGPGYTCAVTAGGGAKCWGANETGQLGDGTTTARSAPVDVASLSSGVASISAGGTRFDGFNGGGGHTCALLAAGGTKCWGENTYGQLGDGSTIPRLTPTDVFGLVSGVAGISTGGLMVNIPGTSNMGFASIPHTCAVTTAGAAKCWGSNRCSALGSGVAGNCGFFGGDPGISSVPVNVLGLSSGVAAVSAGGAFSCALVTTGRVYCWGGSDSSSAPAPVLEGTLPQAIAFGAAPTVPIGGTGMVAATGGASGIPVSFASLTPSICSVSGSTVSGLASGMCTIAGNQAGDDWYEPAPQATLTFRIGDPVAQSITFGPAPALAVGTVATLSATATSGLAVSFRSNTPGFCSVSGDVVTGVAAGDCTVSASQAGDALYAPAPEVTQTFPVTANDGSFGLRVVKSGSGGGNVVSTPAGIACGAGCAANFAAGTAVVLGASADADSVFGGWSGACAGAGNCTVLMNAVRSATATFHPATTIPRLANISTRVQVLQGDDVLIGGFVIGGTTAKTVVVRARGPSLVSFGIENALADPTLRLVRSSDQATIGTNDNWGAAANAAAIQSSGFAPTHGLESAILMQLPPGAYTAIVSGVGGTGIGIVEVFEVDAPAVPLVNISTRGRVQGGDAVMIGGFVIQGSAPRTVLIRARGPSLAAFGISSPLANPAVRLVRSSDQTQLAANDHWEDAPNVDAIQASRLAPSHPAEAAILVTLPPGAYTAVVFSPSGLGGVAIIEVFAQ